MDQSPSWEANSHSASKEIPRTLWNLQVHFRVLKGQTKYSPSGLFRSGFPTEFC